MAITERIVIATHNPGKKDWYSKLFSNLVKEVLVLSDLGIKEKPQEAGDTAEENAQIKACFYAKLTNNFCFSEDASLFVDFLPAEKQPGVNVRRVNGKELSDDELFAYWEVIVSRTPKDKRTGRWHTAYCLAAPDGRYHTFALDHHRLFFYPASKVRIPGWPVSSLQGPAMFNKPHSELTQAEVDESYRETRQKVLEEVNRILTNF